jgi:hypothetical protein
MKQYRVEQTLFGLGKLLLLALNSMVLVTIFFSQLWEPCIFLRTACEKAGDQCRLGGELANQEVCSHLLSLRNSKSVRDKRRVTALGHKMGCSATCKGNMMEKSCTRGEAHRDKEE